jgi:hypothetical protein
LGVIWARWCCCEEVRQWLRQLISDAADKS